MALYFEGTVIPAGPAKFDAEYESKRLYKAIKGLGTDEKTIIDVLCANCNSERQEIKEKYKTMYGQDLIDDLKGDLSGYFEKLCLSLMMPSRLYDAWCLHEAIEGIGTREKTLMEILCTRNNHQIEEIKLEYNKFFNKNLEEDICNDTSGDFKTLLVGLLQANRNEEGILDKDLIRKDARDLLKAGKNIVGTDEHTINRILLVRSRLHLQAVFRDYAEMDDNGIEGAIKSETSGNYRKALLAIVACLKDPLDYFSSSFHGCLKGLGTDDKGLIQLVVSHSEIDLKDIAKSYMKKYGLSLSKAIADDTSGDYRRLLVRLTDISEK